MPQNAEFCCAHCGRPFRTNSENGMFLDGTVLFYSTPEYVESIKLTGLEASILRYLAPRFGAFVHRERIFTNVWGANSDALPKILDVMICKLNAKLADTPYHLRNQWGFGYGLFFKESVGNCAPVNTTNPTENVVYD